MLAALLQSPSEAGELLRERGVTASGIFDKLSPLHRDPQSRNSTPGSPRDLIAEATRGELHPVLGRDEATTQLMDILVGRRHHPVVLGEKGVGRTAIVEALARILVRSDAPKAVRGSKLFVADSSLLDDGFDANPLWSSGSSRVLLFVQDPIVLAQTARALRAAEPP